jgi:hypothetical protein
MACGTSRWIARSSLINGGRLVSERWQAACRTAPTLASGCDRLTASVSVQGQPEFRGLDLVTVSSGTTAG